MAIGKRGETLQAIEINEQTKLGTLANEGGTGTLLHMMADGDVTFHFASGDKTVTLTAGSDVVAGTGCTGITTTVNVIAT